MPIINSELNQKIENINKFIANEHDATAFIYFKVNDFVLDTSSPDSRKHYAVSLTNQKTGVGAGNQFTLEIIYHKDFAEEIYDSANKLEYALSTLRKVSTSLNNQEQIQRVNDNNCVLRYGYLKQKSNPPTYVGKLLKYTVDANRQILKYTLYGYTGEQATIGTVNWYPRIKYDDDPKRTNDGSVIAEIQTKLETESLTTEEIKYYIESLNTEYLGSIVFNPYRALKAFIKDYNNDIDKMPGVVNATKFEVEDQSGILGESDEGNNLKYVRLSLCRNQTPLDYVKYLISMFEDNISDYAIEQYKKEAGITNRWVYEVKRKPSEGNNIIYIQIRKISSENSDTYTYRFDAYAPNNNLLIDYNFNYDGTVALTVANTMNSEDDNNAVYIRSDGLISAKASITNDMFVAGAIDEVLIRKQNYWMDKISCANNCSMTTFGLPFEIPVSTTFMVTMTISNKLYHSSGICYVTGITDKIQNNIFTTEFSMVRLPGKGQGVETLV